MKKNKKSVLIEYFKPSVYIKSFRNIDVNYLKHSNIKYFICDLDGTLMSLEYQRIPKRAAINFVKEIKALNIKFIIVSNNSKKRVEKISKILDCDEFYAKAFKPSIRILKKIVKKYSCEKNEILVMGNTVVTDILFANRFGCDSILVQNAEGNTRFFYRAIEKIVYKRLERQNLLISGKINDIFKEDGYELL